MSACSELRTRKQPIMSWLGVAAMRVILFRWVSVIGVAAVFASAFLWLTRSPPDNIIPTQFRGVWLDQGAECSDTDAKVVITATTIDYDSLTFKADGLSGKAGDFVALSGEAFPSGRATREKVTLRTLAHRTQLLIGGRDHNFGPFVRCSPTGNS